MERNFQIVDGIYLAISDHELDLHNNYDFQTLHYNVVSRKLSLEWKRGIGNWVSEDTPQFVAINFQDVHELRFFPRDNDVPFTEDDCVNSVGYWVDEDWANGVITLDSGQVPEPEWLMAIDFMSGAVVAIRASNAIAVVGN